MDLSHANNPAATASGLRSTWLPVRFLKACNASTQPPYYIFLPPSPICSFVLPPTAHPSRQIKCVSHSRSLSSVPPPSFLRKIPVPHPVLHPVLRQAPHLPQASQALPFLTA
ncbi:hypothetical protein BD779DRAFT_1551539 [Infundibulicybe gibba]|nr:hypothetical protein BD779DRAFT_1551539 [Infundibulicybe gibba]